MTNTTAGEQCGAKIGSALASFGQQICGFKFGQIVSFLLERRSQVWIEFVGL
jgi:hypothetical protein